MSSKAVALTCDVSKEDEVKLMVEQTVAQLGRLDVVCYYLVDFYFRRSLISALFLLNR